MASWPCSTNAQSSTGLFMKTTQSIHTLCLLNLLILYVCVKLLHTSLQTVLCLNLGPKQTLTQTHCHHEGNKKERRKCGKGKIKKSDLKATTHFDGRILA